MPRGSSRAEEARPRTTYASSLRTVGGTSPPTLNWGWDGVCSPSIPPILRTYCVLYSSPTEFRITFRASEPARVTPFPGSALFETRNRVPRLRPQVGPVSPKRPKAAKAEARLLAEVGLTVPRHRPFSYGAPRHLPRTLPSLWVEPNHRSRGSGCTTGHPCRNHPSR